MKKFLVAVLGIAILSGCAAPRYTAKPIETDTSNVEIVIIKDKETRDGFQETMETWLKANNYTYTVQPDGSKHDLNKLTLEYEGNWAWDLALYLKSAEINAFQNGQRVGNIKFQVPYTANPSKFGNAADRISYMMSALFGQITADEATKKVNGSSN
ncbi:Sbal_3080 family lipoprotein [Shewanella sp. KJ2020]|uniref:Sbal_3080 family lipoprotein n=1 Tax=Shewanella sp. KJ2020 TaxID=2919172 RepID=UPI0020A73326|nr:Sbal_3080 family lipoprotein [Shewanella sp. KJ2020]MCP3127912.1 Sbal_3080 family lipoprotein [Shewanella sp. KJ2020]